MEKGEIEKIGAPRYRRSLRDWLALGVAVAASVAWLFLMLRGR